MTDTATDIEPVALALAQQLNLQGASVPRAGVERYLTRTQPSLDPAQVLDHAVACGWLEISDDGLRVIPGRAYPQVVLGGLPR
jgi:hypothetical protein